MEAFVPLWGDGAVERRMKTIAMILTTIITKMVLLLLRSNPILDSSISPSKYTH